MRIRWSPSAAEDLEEIFNYIEADSPSAAERVVKSIYDRAVAVGKHPYQGRRGRVEGTRELPLPPLPYIVIYRVREGVGAVEIVNIIHGAQRWPPAI